jgi:hypothetical protein
MASTTMVPSVRTATARFLLREVHDLGAWIVGIVQDHRRHGADGRAVAGNRPASGTIRGIQRNDADALVGKEGRAVEVPCGVERRYGHVERVRLGQPIGLEDGRELDRDLVAVDGVAKRFRWEGHGLDAARLD